MAQAPVVAGQKTKVIPLRVNQSLADQLAELAEQRGVPRSRLMREVLTQFIDDEGALAS